MYFNARSGPLEIALALMRLDHVASVILNANHGITAYQARPYPKIRRRMTIQIRTVSVKKAFH